MNDSGVLISAYQGTNEVSLKAILILNDVNRQFMTSSFVQLEVLSKAIYHQQTTEIEFYETFFATCYIWSDDYSSIVFLAKELARRYGLNALDSLHLACAILGDGDEFVTTEKNSKPIHRVQEITTISISD
ncbi:type II toxin-antitoxin system VapC family toxin [Crocosphaera watsonii]|uniref:PIN domain-containing protein n=3 Tax=Crocosphaera watsonii TaxID=263511 RepID=G5J9A2_CROWT|nr:PIN domain-containing protein [Crocosphaera watsonii]EHJ11232.1 hypothetical protein CWATWH0003_4019 [Crocosphaera watsonii WH 0003]CCQ55230.1 hypothetical protein CWATWH0005_5807 [Crocosphaera watsonii WH 0005]